MRLVSQALWIIGFTATGAFGSASAQEQGDSTRLRVIQ